VDCGCLGWANGRTIFESACAEGISVWVLGVRLDSIQSDVLLCAIPNRVTSFFMIDEMSITVSIAMTTAEKRISGQ
jgi:hypothetical protein